MCLCKQVVCSWLQLLTHVTLTQDYEQELDAVTAVTAVTPKTTAAGVGADADADAAGTSAGIEGEEVRFSI